MNKEEPSNLQLDDQVVTRIETALNQIISRIESLPATDDPEIRRIFLKTLGHLLSAEDELLNSKPKDKRLM